MLSKLSPKTAAKWVFVWFAGNLAWTLLSAASGAITSALLKGLGVLDNTFALVGVAFAVAAAVAALAGALKRPGAMGRTRDRPQAGSIAAGHGISAGGDVSATTSIEAGHGIHAGGNIHSGAPLSDADRRRIARETEGRLAREIHDPTLRAFDEKNKERQAETPGYVSPVPKPDGKALLKQAARTARKRTPEPKTTVALADRLARLHGEGRKLRHGIKPDLSDPWQALAHVGTIFKYPAAPLSAERNVRRWADGPTP